MRATNERDVQRVHGAAKKLQEILEMLCSEVRVGMTGRELDKRAQTLIHKAGGKPAFIGYGNPPFPAALCVSRNDCVVHGIPDAVPFVAGDIIGLDIGMIYDGIFTDMARTVTLDPVSRREQELVRATYDALPKFLSVIRPGSKTGDLGYAMQTYFEGLGFGVVRDLAGHGVGDALHEPPEIPNFGTPGKGAIFSKGMVIAVEPMVTLGDWRVRIDTDGWSVKTRDGSKTAHTEDMVLVTDTGAEILTR
ncbi:MAG: type I methionyl aminopeptidase [Candidatus Komeilibacteria bacterium RIFCSPLOWO2_01_FULL_52_15]|uniref:Methionine aminopeptidase n=2 Tax=Candidatus Komeiliibacteriota TaxID=1817908 RepID=A0A1G2BPG0_9BACT|nr:MAG: type I methionyl aminopeptidase [Candidatus Komeilibacteria bacterium RIFCSPHIGHO2_01_FULL_52_14]OGY91004.1 MAG: type I methionyl aminopeptidase [Candidatus Komeilibacteria bacterium RIFCSPLOWO2_01_FULL_52_15]